MKPPDVAGQARTPTGVGRIVLVYVISAGLWTALSGGLVARLGPDPAWAATAAAVADAAFILATAALLYMLVGRLLQQQRQALGSPLDATRDADRSSALLQALAESSPDAIFAKDRDGRYLLFNREAARVVGRTSEQVIGHDDREIFPPEQAALLRANDQRVMAQDLPLTFEEELDTAVGRLTFLATKGPLRDARGQVVGLFGISRDLTERLAAQRRLSEGEQRYRLLFESNLHAILAYDIETLRVLAVNDAALAHYGYSRDELLALTVDALWAAEDRDRLQDWLRALSDETSADGRRAGICVHRSKDGGLLEAEVARSALVLDGRRAVLLQADDVTDKLKLERQLAAAHASDLASRDLLRDVLARVDDGVLALDVEQRYTYVNSRAAQLLGHAQPDDLLGRHIWTEFPQIVGSSFHRAYEQAMSTQRSVVVEECFAAVGRWFEGRLYPSPQGLSIYFSDITARKEAEKTMRLSELRYRLAATHGQVWDWDMSNDYVEFPTGYWQLMGREPPPPQEVVASFTALMHPEDRPRWRQALREHLARRAPYDLEYRAHHADGEWRWFHTQGQAVWNEQGHATYMAGTTFDITERKRAEAALRESEAYRRNLFEQLGDGVLLLDVEHRILDANPQALAMLGYERDELLRCLLPDLLTGFERPRLAGVVAKLMAGQAQLGEWEHLRKDGSHFPAENSARMLDVGRYVAVLRDITARRANESALLTTQLELSELTQRLLTQEKLTTQRVAQALHDNLGQTLAVARLNLDACMALHGPVMPVPLQQQGHRIAALLDQAVREVRQVLTELRPPLLEDQGLAAALDNEIGARAEVGGADLLLELSDGAARQRWPAEVEYGAFMVAREAIANAQLHAGASLVRVLLNGDEGALRLDVIDDGAGITVSLIRGRPGHLGIVGMRERSIAIGARCTVGPTPAGGTQVAFCWEARKS